MIDHLKNIFYCNIQNDIIMTKYVYKIMSLNESIDFSYNGYFTGNEQDVKKGGIYMCKDIEQVKIILMLHYKYQECCIYQFNTSNIENLKYEYDIKYKEYFPHVYSTLKFEHVTDLYILSNIKNDKDYMYTLHKLNKKFNIYED
jgi:uncharacterized protein (DUF952 family)